MPAKQLRKFTGTERKLLRAALFDAYGDEGSLRMMLDDELDWKLAEIAAAVQTMPEILDAVITHAEEKGGAERLLVAARVGNPGNPTLNDAIERIMLSRRPPYFRTGATPLNTSHQDLLVNALQQCARLSEGPTERPPASVLARLPQDLLTQMLTEAARTLPNDVRAWCRLIIQCAAKHPGGLEYLADLVLALDDGNGAKIFEQEVRKRTGGPLQKTLDECVALAAGAHVEAAAFQALFRACDPSGGFGDDLFDGLTDELQLRLILRHLFLLNTASGGISPVQQFLLKLVEASTDAQGKDAILQHLRAQGVVLASAQKPTPVGKENGIWSVVVVLSEILRDSTEQEQEYKVDVWVRTDDGRDETVELIPDPGALTRARLAELGPPLSNVIKDLASSPDSAKNEIRVEFFLPDSLLGEDVARLKIKSGTSTIVLGRGYPVAIRALARLVVHELRDTWSRWKTKWDHYLEQPHLESIPSPKCEIDAELLLYRLQGIEPGESVHGVRLKELHCDVAEPADLDPRNKCKDAGIPVIVWLRSDSGRSTSAKDELTNLLEKADSNNLKNLPKWAWAQRRQAAATPTSPVHQLAVLWDDPTRIPNGLQSQGVCPDADFEPRVSK